MRKRKTLAGNMLTVLQLVVFLLVLILGVLMIRSKLLNNAENMGLALAQSYAEKEEMQIASFRDLMELGRQYAQDYTEGGSSPEEIQLWLKDYMAKITEVLGPGKVDAYVVVDGKIIAANPWEGDDSYDFTATQWYQDALKNDGKVIFTDVYEDAITGNHIVTASCSFGSKDDMVLAMDIPLENFLIQAGDQLQTEDYTYGFFDRAGNLINSDGFWSIDSQELEPYAQILQENIQATEQSEYGQHSSAITGREGEERGAYFARVSNGWTVMLTIPLHASLLGEQQDTMTVLLLGASLLFVILFAAIYQETRQGRRLRLADETIEILSDAFYAAYRIDYTEGTYLTIKSSGDNAKTLPRKGSYQTLLDTVKQVVAQDAYEEFVQSFSLEQIRQRVAEGIRDYGGDYQRRFGDTFRWVNIRTLYDKERAPDEVILCFRDVDIERRQQLQHTILLESALSAAQKSTKAKSAFFSNMSHDLRTPLNAIINLTALARKNQGNWNRVGDCIDKIEFSGRQMLALVNDILELSRMEAGENALRSQQFDLVEYIQETAAVFQAQAEQEGKDFSVSIDLQDRMVLADNFKVGQILNNLLSNSFKYSQMGAEISLSVRQYDFQQHSKYQFVVADTGIGMAETFLDRLFEPYTRENHFSTQVENGVGLGMHIVKSLVRQMSGEITVESTLGEGSKFTVTLPLQVVRTPELPEEPPMEETPPEEAAPSAEEKSHTLAGLTVLLAEDNEINMEIATEMLEMNGVQVIPACNGVEAVEKFRQSAPYAIGAVLMDMQMPEMDGCEAARAIRDLERPDAASVPIVAVTANAFAEDIAKTTEAGMNGHISKPVDFGLLCRTLAELTKETEHPTPQEPKSPTPS